MLPGQGIAKGVAGLLGTRKTKETRRKRLTLVDPVYGERKLGDRGGKGRPKGPVWSEGKSGEDSKGKRGTSGV